jgi:hypothetical protein
MSIRTMTTGQEKRKTIPKPNPNLNPISMIWAATRSNMSRYGAIPARKAAPLIKRKNLPTFCTVVSGFWFTSAICANPEYQYRLVRAGSWSSRRHRIPKPRQINEIPIPAATLRLALANGGITTTDTGGDNDAGDAPLRGIPSSAIRG